MTCLLRPYCPVSDLAFDAAAAVGAGWRGSSMADAVRERVCVSACVCVPRRLGGVCVCVCCSLVLVLLLVLSLSLLALALGPICPFATSPVVCCDKSCWFFLRRNKTR